METTPDTRRRGRPRNPNIDHAIRAAVLELLREVGYGGITIEGVAQRAGVAHTTVYRRWPSKLQMVHEIVFPDDAAPRLAPDVPFDEIVHHYVHGMIESGARPEVRAALPGLLVDGYADTELRQRLTERFQPAMRDSLRRAARTGMERGQIRADLDVDVFADMMLVLVFVYMAPYARRRSARHTYAETVSRILLDGVRPPADKDPK